MKQRSSSPSLLNFCAASLLLIVSTTAFSGTKVAFTGDQGTDENSRAVLAMIASEGTDLLLIQGDLGYDPGVAGRWEANLTQALGANFPVLSVVGNHENHEWDNYQQYIKQRVDRAGGLDCTGDVGVKAHCQFGNIEIVQVSPGINEISSVHPDDNYAQYITDKFSGESNKWRICTWHKNMRAMQTGEKGNSTGWGVYQSCLNVGAIVAVAHEHAYSRTHLMSNYENQSVASHNSNLVLEPGRSFMFVSGLGGRSVRPQTQTGDWWASTYTATQGATHGALFCDFEQSTAECYFKAINGAVPDRFTLQLKSGGSNIVVADNNNNNTPQVVSPPPAQRVNNLPAVFKRSDSDEIRWIDYDANGNVGSVWIDQSCANAMGGVDVSGTWDDLVQLAPGTDSIANPCEAGNAAPSADNTSTAATGYVFGRTDKDELRWVDRNANGQIGSVHINDACADKFGGVKASGDWSQLTDVAPATDSIANPCSGDAPVAGNSAPSELNSEVGYVFSRTDKDEMRWVGRTSSGDFGSVRINKVCADNLGGAYASGDWFHLLERAPASGAVAYPCNDNDAPAQSSAAPPAPSQSSDYVFERTDKHEFRWVAKTSNGNIGNIWIDESCVQRLGLPIVKGDWDRLNEVAPIFDALKDPCAN